MSTNIFITKAEADNKYLYLAGVGITISGPTVSVNSASLPAIPLPISGLIAATKSNILDSVGYIQEWRWSGLTSGSGLILSSTSSSATGNLQTLISITMSGTNSNASQTTTSIRVSNTKTGTGAVNIGLYSAAGGGSTNWASWFDGNVRLNGQITFNNSNSIVESSSSLGVYSNSFNLFQSIGVGPALSVNSGGLQNFAAGWVNSYSQPYMTLGAYRENATQWRSYLQYPIIFQNINGDVSLSQDNGLTYANTFTPTERVRFKVNGQVGFGTPSPTQSAKVEISSTQSGFLKPVMTTTQRDAITIPANGLEIYNSTSNTPNYYNGTSWVSAVAVSGTFSGVGAATTTFTVTIPTQSNSNYKAFIQPTNLLSTAVQYTNNYTTTTFDVVYLTGLTGTVEFNWVLFP